MQKQPLIILCICFILGIFIQEFALFPKFWVGFLLALQMGFAILFFVKNLFLQKLKPFFLGFLFFTVGVFSHFLNSQNPRLPLLNDKEEIVFSIDKKLNSNEKNRRFEITAWKGGEDFKSVVSIPKSVLSPDFSHYYKGMAYIHKTEPPKNDYQFDYKKYLARKKIYFQAYLIDGYSVAAKPRLTFSDQIKQKRLEVLNKIDQASLKQSSKDFLKGLILADRTEMDASVTQDFTKTGLVHFLAISGTHMVVIFISMMFVLKRIFTKKFHKIAIILSLIFIWLFAVFIDYGSSVMRSCLMITIYYGFVLLQRKPDLLHSMAVAAFVLLITDTHQIFDVGFQLSFIAVFGIFWLDHPILNLLPRPKNRFQTFIFQVISLTLSAQIITLPLILYYFHQFSLVSILANLFVVPFSELIIVFSLVMVVVLSLNISSLNTIYDFLVDALLKTIHFFAEFKVTFFQHIPFTLIEMVLLFTAIFLLRSVLTKKNAVDILRFGFAFLLFLAVKFCLDIFSFNKNDVLVHHLYKDKIFSVKQHGTVYFWVKQNISEDLFKKNIVSPYLSASRGQEYKVFIIPVDAESVMFRGVRYRLE